MNQISECPGCYAGLPEFDGPTHRYIGASPACWDVYTRLMAGDPSLPAAKWRPLLVDTYAAQHPGGSSPQATQSVAVHLVVLHAMLSEGHALAEAIDLRVTAVEVGRAADGYPKLKPVPADWDVTVTDLTKQAPTNGSDLADRYVEDVYNRWAELRGEQIGRWYRAVAHAT